MQKKQKNFEKRFKMPHLFREDLEQIEALIKQDLKPQEYELESDEFRYKTLGEAIQDTTKTNIFDIRTSCPHLYIAFRESFAIIWADNCDLQMIGAITELIEIISRRERKFRWYFSYLAPYLCLSVFMFLFIFYKREPSRVNEYWFWFGALAAIMGLIIGAYNILHKFSLIEFKYKKDRPNFFVRNKDQIILLAIGTFLAAVAAVSFEKLF